MHPLAERRGRVAGDAQGAGAAQQRPGDSNGELAVLQRQGRGCGVGGIDLLAFRLQLRLRCQDGLVGRVGQLDPGFHREAAAEVDGLGEGRVDPIALAVQRQAAALARFQLDVDRLAAGPKPLDGEAVVVVLEHRVLAAVVVVAHDLHQVARRQPVVDGEDLELAVGGLLIAGQQAVEDQPGFFLLHLLPVADLAVLELRVDDKAAIVGPDHAIEAVIADGVAQFDRIAALQLVQRGLVILAHLDPHTVGAVVVIGAAHAGNHAGWRLRAVACGADVIQKVQRQENVLLAAAQLLGLGVAGDLGQAAVCGDGKAERGCAGRGRRSQQDLAGIAHQLRTALGLLLPLHIVGGDRRSVGHEQWLPRAVLEPQPTANDAGNAVVLHLVGDRVDGAEPVVLHVENPVVACTQRHQIDLAAAAVVSENVPALLLVGRGDDDAEPAVVQVLEQPRADLGRRLVERLVLYVAEIERVHRLHLTAAGDLHGLERRVALAAALVAHLQLRGKLVGDAVQHEAVHQQGAARRLTKHVKVAIMRDQLHRGGGGQVRAGIDRAQQVPALCVSQLRLLLGRD